MLAKLGRCGKVSLQDELDAKIVFADMVKRDKEPLRWYECPVCGPGNWHITSEIQRTTAHFIPPEVALHELALIA